MKTDKKIEKIIDEFTKLSKGATQKIDMFGSGMETKYVDVGFVEWFIRNKVNTEVQKAVEEAVRGFAEFVKTEYTGGSKLAKDDYMDIEVKRFDKYLKTYLQTLEDKDDN